MSTARLWRTGLMALAVGCIREPDPGGQEGEELVPTAENEGTSSGDDSDYGGGEGEGEGEGGGGGDTGAGDSDLYSRISGERTHLRGQGERGDYDCSVLWSLDGEAGAGGCPDCAYTFSVNFTLDAEASTHEAYACDDVYGSETATLGLMADYNGYGPAIVGIYDGHPYLLGFARWNGDEVGWSYGYVDEEWRSDGVYYTWFFEVSATLE